MPRDLEWKLENHRESQRRRDAGLPVWDMTIRLGDLAHNKDMTFEDRRDATVKRIRDSGWVERAEPINDANPEFGGGPLDRVLEELAEAYDPEEFAELWDDICDRADAPYEGSVRVFLDTVSHP